MHDLAKAVVSLMFALPLAALARPVTVVTHSTGTADINPSALDGLRLTDPSGATALPDTLPYTLTLTSRFDLPDPLPARDDWGSQPASQVTIDFTLGDLAYHYAGEGSSSALLFTPYPAGGDGYQHEIWLDPPGGGYGYAFQFAHTFVGPAGSLGEGGALTPNVTEGSWPNARFTFTAYRSNDEYSFAFPMGGQASTFSVRVTSPVPEPAAYALLAAGVLTVGIRRRRTSAAA